LKIWNSQWPGACDMAERIAAHVSIIFRVRQFPDAHAVQHDPNNTVKSVTSGCHRGPCIRTNIEPGGKGGFEFLGTSKWCSLARKTFKGRPEAVQKTGKHRTGLDVS